MPPVLILALVGAVLALLANGNEGNLEENQQKELEKLQNDLAEARKNLRHAQNAKKRFITTTGAKQITEGTE